MTVLAFFGIILLALVLAVIGAALLYGHFAFTHSEGDLVVGLTMAVSAGLLLFTAFSDAPFKLVYTG